MKKMLLVAVCLLISGCTEDGIIFEPTDSSRMEVKSNTSLNGYRLTVLFDTKTGREYLAYSAGGLVEIKPKGE